MKIKRRIGTTPQQRGSLSGQTCPDMFELENGNYAVMGTALEEDASVRLPEGVVLKPGERIIIVPAVLLADAKPDIPVA